MKHRTTLRIVSLSAAIALVGAACGGSDEPAPTSSSTAVPATEAPAAATTQSPSTQPPATTAASPGTTSTSVDVTPPATTGPPPTTQAPPTTSAAADQIVTIGDLFFRPSALTVSVGQSVSFQNNGDLPHTSTSGTPGARSDLWHSGTLSSGESFVVTFDTAGTFSYFCAIHPNDMQATVTVGG